LDAQLSATSDRQEWLKSDSKGEKIGTVSVCARFFSHLSQIGLQGLVIPPTHLLYYTPVKIKSLFLAMSL
jgi:hypothetical protein